MLQQARIDDVAFVVGLTRQWAIQGHFDLDPHDEQAVDGYRRELEQIIRTGHRPYKNLKAELYVWRIGEERAGFVILSEILPGVGTEILSMALDEAFHGRGQGRALLDAVLEGPLQNGSVYARCHPQSQRLYEMLRRRGFDHPQDGEQGTRFLVRKAAPPSPTQP